MKWTRAGQVLLVEGKALHPGVFQGLDGHRVEYPPEIFNPEHIEFVGRKIKLLHKDDAESVVGFITGYTFADDGVYIRGYVFDKKAIEEITENGINGFSIEAKVQAYKDGQVYRAVKVRISAVAIVPNPAAPYAGVKEAKVTTLLEAHNSRITTLLTRLENFDSQVNEMPEEQTQITTNVNENVDYVKPEEPEVALDAHPQEKPETVETEQTVEVEAESKAKTLLAWIKKQLKDAKVEKDVIDKIMSVLKMVIPEDYPYPYPKPEEVEELKAKNADYEKTVSELNAKLEEAEKAKAELEMRLAELEKKLKEVEAELRAEIEKAWVEKIQLMDPEFKPEFKDEWGFDERIDYLKAELERRLETPEKAKGNSGTKDVLTWLAKLWE